MEQLASPSTAALVAEIGSVGVEQYIGSAGAYLIAGFVTGTVGTVAAVKAVRLGVFLGSVGIVTLFAGTRMGVIDASGSELIRAAQSGISLPQVPAIVVELFTVLPFLAGVAIGVAVAFTEL